MASYGSFLPVLSLLLLLRHIRCGLCTLPSPVHCSGDTCTLTNYQGVWMDRSPCRASKVFYPKTEQQLVAAVAEAVRTKAKAKVVTEISHSMSKIACPGGDRGVMISTRDYVPDPILVDTISMTASVDAGMQLRDFVRQLADKHGLTIPHTPLWDGVSIGGVIATGSHGSGFFLKGSVVSEYVTRVRMVVSAPPAEGFAKVIELQQGRDDDLLRAARMSLGVLGVVSKVTFSVLPLFKRSLSLDLATDHDLQERLVPFSRSHAFASLFWVPSTSKVLYKKEDWVPVDVEGDGANMFPLVQPMRVSQVETMRSHQELVETTKNVAGLCIAGEKMVEHRLASGDGYVSSEKGGAFTGYPIVGFNHRMQTVGGCQVADSQASAVLPPATKFNVVDSAVTSAASGNVSDWWTCKWDPRISKRVFYHHTAVAIPLSRAGDFIEDVKRLRMANPESMCSLNMFGGIHVRFVAKSDAYLGDKEDAAVFELVYYRAREAGTPRLNEDMIEELEQMMVFKYGGKPHFGKNRDVAFVGAASKVADAEAFLRVKQTLDPRGVFSSEWSDKLLGVRRLSESGEGGDFCALEGLCVCSEDRHCAPQAGYTCQAGRVFTEARVCREGPRHGGS